MKLLITTQAVDVNDSNLGFFIRWIEEFAKHVERVEVLCLRQGEYSLPANVHIHPLRSRNNHSRLKATFNFYRYLWKLRNEYDTVFVHMNPEYVVLGGFLWQLMHKTVALWYTHKSVDLKLRIAVFFANSIFTASKESFRLPSTKVHIVGHGIDTAFFMPDQNVIRGDWALSVGRLSKSKRHDLAIEDVAKEGKPLRIAGEGPERDHLEQIAREHQANVTFLGGLTQLGLRSEYRKAAYLVHTSETGSLDKVVLEALACGLPIHTKDPALKALEKEGPEYVREHHSLHKLIPAMLSLLPP